MSPNFVESSSLYAVLQLLSDGEFHSGEELGLLLGVSRAAVWKTLKKFEPLGVDITSVKGRGYCISGGLDLLDKSRINPSVDASLSINVLTQVDST
ncbi:MAG TPA: HTH domain-containing protein, partial [Cellvibrio sp.]